MPTVNEIFYENVHRAMGLKGLVQDDVFARIGCSRRTFVDKFSFERMCEMEFLLDTPARDLWNVRTPEGRRTLGQAKRGFERRFRTEEAIDWARRFPIRELQRLGHIRSTGGLNFEKRFRSGLLPRELMKFMGGGLA